MCVFLINLLTYLLKAKFHYAIWFEAGSKLVADRFEAGSKLYADLQRAEIWPII